jgi:hypothetical protein
MTLTRAWTRVPLLTRRRDKFTEAAEAGIRSQIIMDANTKQDFVGGFWLLALVKENSWTQSGAGS